MTTVDEIFIGVTLVGLGMAVKVYQEGEFQLRELMYKRELFGQASEQYRQSLEEEQKLMELQQESLEAQKQELKMVKEKQTNLDKRIGHLENKLGPEKRTRFRVEM